MCLNHIKSKRATRKLKNVTDIWYALTKRFQSHTRAAIAGYYITLTPRNESSKNSKMRRARGGHGRKAGIYYTHLLSRQQIHSAHGDELGDVCTATIFLWNECETGVVQETLRSSVVVMSWARVPSPPLCDLWGYRSQRLRFNANCKA